MPDFRADAVSQEVAAYAAAHTTAPDDVQRALMAATADRTGGFSRMQIGGDQGVLMEILTRSIGARSAIEIGTFTGYSSMSIARGLGPDGRLICCDVSDEWTAIAREYWELAGIADRIDLRIAPALETIASLGPEHAFDLAFIDADKSNYANYYEALLPKMRVGGLILVDNTLWSGQVLDESTTDTDTMALRAFNDLVAADDRVRVVLVTIGDGLSVIEKR
jgi:caffeoyl-CoA O-methyltransferase